MASREQMTAKLLTNWSFSHMNCSQSSRASHTIIDRSNRGPISHTQKTALLFNAHCCFCWPSLNGQSFTQENETIKFPTCPSKKCRCRIRPFFSVSIRWWNHTGTTVLAVILNKSSHLWYIPADTSAKPVWPERKEESPSSGFHTFGWQQPQFSVSWVHSPSRLPLLPWGQTAFLGSVFLLSLSSSVTYLLFRGVEHYWCNICSLVKHCRWHTAVVEKDTEIRQAKEELVNVVRDVEDGSSLLSKTYFTQAVLHKYNIHWITIQFKYLLLLEMIHFLIIHKSYF